MHTKNPNPSDKEQILKNCYRQYLVFMCFFLGAIVFAAGASGASSSHSHFFDLLGLLLIVALAVAAFIFRRHIRSLFKKNGIEDADWFAYFFRQPFKLHALIIGVSSFVAMFAVFKCMHYFFSHVVHAS
jgi:hypothetical protein